MTREEMKELAKIGIVLIAGGIAAIVIEQHNWTAFFMVLTCYVSWMALQNALDTEDKIREYIRSVNEHHHALTKQQKAILAQLTDMKQKLKRKKPTR